MAVTTKTRPASARDDAARARLAEAKLTLAEKQAEVRAAEEAHEAAQRAHWNQLDIVAGIQATLDQIAQEYRRVPAPGRASVAERYDVAKLPLADAQRPLAELAAAEQATAARLKDAEGRLSFYVSKVREVAEATVRIEMLPAAEAAIAALNDAFDTIRRVGPDVWDLASGLPRNLAVRLPEEASRVLSVWTEFPEFASRCRNSAFSAAVQALVADTDAAPISLPSPTESSHAMRRLLASAASLTEMRSPAPATAKPDAAAR
jgi:hypothetical protein